MKLTNRLKALEKQRKIIYPTFSDMHETSTKETYINALSKLNPSVDINELASLRIVTIEDMYLS